MNLDGLGINIFDRRTLLKSGVAAMALSGMAAVPKARANELDLSTPEGNIKAWVKLDGSLEDGAATLGMWDGIVMSVWGQQQTVLPLFGFKGFGYSRWFDNKDGTYTKLHKEVGFYTDLATGEVLEEWENPYLDGERVKVWPVANDPVNIVLQPILQGGYDPNFRQEFILPWYTYGDSRISTSQDVNLRWPNLVTKDKWPREFTGDYVRVGEYFQLHTDRDMLMDPDVPSLAPTGAWQRLGNYLPWMLMEQRPGHLFYRTNTGKLPGGIGDIPRQIREAAEKQFPDYLEPPEEWTEHNVSSFEVYVRDAEPVPFPPGREPFVPVEIPEPRISEG